MKKTYIKPQAQAVSLFTEDAVLSLSSVEVNRDKETNEVFSEGKGWSSDNWSAADEDYQRTLKTKTLWGSR